jgi:serine/threonine-protein phosphatase 4 regulatory subunit 1
MIILSMQKTEKMCSKPICPLDSTDASTMELFRPPTTGGDQRNTFSVFDPNNSGSSNGSMNNNMKFQQQSPIQDPALPKGPPETSQSIVPQLLIDHFVSMTDPSRVQTVESEIAHHCAFSLPAVALTLGRSNWPLLKETYDCLASDMQWKVRRTLASSIHELGVILGQEAVCNDLIPIFNGFLKDLDEVRIGLLKHLADFMRLLPPDVRREYLPRMSEFLKMDNERNWRFRRELTDQLGQLVPLFTQDEVKQFMATIAMILIKDKVAAVRLSAVHVLTVIVKYLLEDSQSSGLVRVLLVDLVSKLVISELWIHRQTYSTLALQLFEESALDHAPYAQEVLPHLLDLAADPVPNVRLAAARTLKTIRQASKYLLEQKSSEASLF